MNSYVQLCRECWGVTPAPAEWVREPISDTGEAVFCPHYPEAFRDKFLATLSRIQSGTLAR